MKKFPIMVLIMLSTLISVFCKKPLENKKVGFMERFINSLPGSNWYMKTESGRSKTVDRNGKVVTGLSPSTSIGFIKESIAWKIDCSTGPDDFKFFPVKLNCNEKNKECLVAEEKNGKTLFIFGVLNERELVIKKAPDVTYTVQMPGTEPLYATGSIFIRNDDL